MKQARNKPARRLSRKTPPKPSEKISLSAHVQELRKRLFYVALAVGVFGAVAFAMSGVLTRWLLTPAHGQQFIFTTPGGGFDFQFKLCLYAGVAAGIPVIVHQVFMYIHPIIKHETKRFLRLATLASSLLAAGGIAFGYFVGLPAAMGFLLTSFSSEQIKALITIQSYLNFVLVYLLGAALLFQLPLVLLLINRIKPLKPRTLFRQQRWVILGAVIAGAIVSPTPDIQNQLMLSGPIILMYEMSAGIIWAMQRRRRRPRKVMELLKKDADLQAERQAKFMQAQLARQQKTSRVQSVPAIAPVVHTYTSATPTAAVMPIRPSIKANNAILAVTQKPTLLPTPPPTPTRSAPQQPPKPLTPRALPTRRQTRSFSDFARPSYTLTRQPRTS